MDWKEYRAEPTYKLRFESENGYVTADIEFASDGGYWHWSAMILVWKNGERQPEDIGIHKDGVIRLARPVASNSGRASSAEEAKRACEDWLEHGNEDNE